MQGIRLFCVLNCCEHFQLQIPGSADSPAVELLTVQTGYNSSKSSQYAGTTGLRGQSETSLLQPTVSPLQICLCSLHHTSNSLGTQQQRSCQNFPLDISVLKHPIRRRTCTYAMCGQELAAFTAVCDTRVKGSRVQHQSLPKNFSLFSSQTKRALSVFITNSALRFCFSPASA